MSAADTAWVLACAGLVLFMTPGLALFYGGMVPVRNVLTVMLQNIVPLGVVTLTWVLAGYTLAFSNQGNSLVGEFDAAALVSVDTPQFHTVAAGVTIPALAFVAYQMMFAIITPALVTGAAAGRLKFTGWIVFLTAWSILVYPQVARWLWHPKGWLVQLGVQDWAGGLVVHASAGAAAAAVLLVIGRRRGWPHPRTSPNNLPLMLAGAGILWFGWFGLTAGDGLRANEVAAQALTNTQVAGAAALLAWLLVERITSGRSTLAGAASGALAGLVTITPCAGFVGTGAALLIGLIGGCVCCLALRLKQVLPYDDALDVVAVHFVGGVLGSLLLGFFGDSSVNPLGEDGVFTGGGGLLLWHQIVGIVCVVLFSFILSFVIAAVIQRTLGLRESGQEQEDLDRVRQGAAGYALSGITARPTSSGRGATDGLFTGRDGDGGLTAPEYLVGAVVDTSRVDGLRDALLMAGARSLELADAAVYTGTVHTEAFRGEQRRLDFEDRLRVQTAVDSDHEEAVVAVLKRFGAEPASIYRLAITPS